MTTVSTEFQLRLALQRSEERVAVLVREGTELRKELLMRDLAAAYGDAKILPDGTIVDAPAPPPEPAPPEPPT